MRNELRSSMEIRKYYYLSWKQTALYIDKQQGDVVFGFHQHNKT